MVVLCRELEALKRDGSGSGKSDHKNVPSGFAPINHEVTARRRLGPCPNPLMFQSAGAVG
jgi:hypothetical protein